MNSNCIRYNLFIAAIFATSISPAFAQGFKIDTKRLPDASKIERAPLEVQILGPRINVKDLRPTEENTDYMFNVGPAPQAQNHTVQVGVPGGGRSHGQNGGAPNNSVPITRNGLPMSGFESNIGSLNSPPAGALPSSKPHSMESNQSVHAQKIGQNVPKAPRGNPGSMLSAHVPQSTPTLSYPLTPISTSSLNIRTETSATGVLKPGSLLKQSK